MFLSSLLFFFLQVTPVHATATPSENEKYFAALGRTWGFSLRHYLADVRQTRGLRFLFVDVPPEKDPPRWFGFLTPYNPPDHPSWWDLPSKIAQSCPRALTLAAYRKPYDFRPFHGVTHNLITRPVRYLTGKVFKKEKDFSLWITLPGGFWGFMVVYDKADRFYRKQLSEDILARIEEDKSIYETLLQYDFRYDDIHRAVLNGKVTEKEGRAEAYLRNRYLKAYFEYMQKEFLTASAEDSRRVLFANAAFFHIGELATRGVPQSEGYLYGPDFVPHLSAAQVDALLAVNHALQIALDVIPVLVRQGHEWELISRNPNMVRLAENISTQPFSRELYSLRDKGLLTTEGLSYRLQEDAFWQVRFREQEILHISKRRVDADGRVSDEALTLEDIRNEVLDEIRGR